MVFVAFAVDFSGKLMIQPRRSFRSGQAIWLAPSFHGIPPYGAQPLFEARFGPLPMGPPASAELRVIVRSGYRKGFSLDLVAEDAQGTPGVEVGGHDEDVIAVFWSQAFFNIVGLVAGRQAVDGTDTYRTGRGKRVDVFVGEFDFGSTVDHRVGGYVDQNAPSVALFQEIESQCGAVVGLSGEDQNQIGTLRRIGDQYLPGSQGKRDQQQ